MSLRKQQSRTATGDQPIRAARRFEGVYTGVVRENKDVQRMGRLKVWVDILGGDFYDEDSWVTASYCSPFAGATDYDGVNKTGAGGEERPENSQSSYGFWMVPPDINNTVLVMFINGDPSRAVWIGCLFHPKMQYMVPGVPHGNAYDEEEPRPVTEHNRRTKNPVRDDMLRPELEDSNQEGISRGLKDQGLIRDYVRGMTDSGARRESPSEVYGILTPGPARDDVTSSEERVNTRKGGSQFVMDDGPGREKIRLRTRTGSQILLDESNGMVYINNRDGTAWIQMDANGRVDVYGAESITMRSERDFTIRADRDIVMEAGRDISLKANRDWQESSEGSQHQGEAGVEEGGNITLQANNNLDIMVANDHRLTVNRDGFINYGRDRNTIVGQDDNTQVDRNSYLTVNRDDYRIAVNGDYHNTAGGNSEQFAGNDMKLQAVNDVEIHAYQGKMDVGSQLNMSLKTKKGDFSAIAEDAKGQIIMKSAANKNQLIMSNPSILLESLGDIKTLSKQAVSFFTNEDFDVDDNGDFTKGGSPISDGCLSFDGGVNIKFDPVKVEFDVMDNVATRIQNRIDKFGNKIETSTATIVNGIETIEKEVNKLSDFVGQYVSDIMGVIDGFSLSSLFPDFSLPFPQLPQFPSFSLPPFPPQLPSLNLPNFPFDFCVDFGSLIKIDGFNPFADSLFGEINLDLGGWTRSNIGGWFNRQKSQLKGSVDSFKRSANIGAQFREVIRDVRGDVNRLSNQLKNLTSFSVTLSSNGDYLRGYSLGIKGFSDSLGRYNSLASGVPGAGESLDALQNDLKSHARTMEQLVKLTDQDPSAVEGFDYTELEEMAEFFDSLDVELSEIVELPPGAA